MILGLDSLVIQREHISNPSVRIEEICGLNIAQGEGEKERQGGEGPNTSIKRNLGGQCASECNQPMKKSKSERMLEMERVRKGSFTEKWRTMTIKERCAMMEKAILAEEEMSEIPVEFQDMWEHIEELAMRERKKTSERKQENSSTGGGG